MFQTVNQILVHVLSQFSLTIDKHLARGILLFNPPNVLSFHRSKSCPCPYFKILYITNVSYFQGRSTLHRTCAGYGYFDLSTFSLESMTFTLKILFGQLLRNYNWQLLHIFRAYKSDMETMHCSLILTF